MGGNASSPRVSAIYRELRIRTAAVQSLRRTGKANELLKNSLIANDTEAAG